MRVNDRHVSFYYENDLDYGKIEVEPKKTALLVIDMQHVFITRKNIPNPTPQQRQDAARWEQFYRAIDDTVVPNVKKLLETFRARGLEVIFCKILARKKNGADRSLDQKATGYNELLLLAGDPLSDIVPELAPLEDEIVITKTTDSALTGSSLRLILHNMGIDTCVVTGVLTDQCVSGTVRSLADESYKVWLVEDACRASTLEIQQAELAILNNIYCHVVNTQEIIQALEQAQE